MVVIKCKYCSSEFDAKRRDQMFCSKKCKNAKWFRDNREHKNNYDKKRREANPALFILYTKQFRKRHPKKRWEEMKRARAKNPKLKYYTAILGVIKTCFKTGRSGLKSKYIQALPFSLDELKDHLIGTLPNGYSWEDYLNGELHLDHIKPHSLFDYTTMECEDFLICWSLDNLQLLQKEINILKNNNYEQH